MLHYDIIASDEKSRHVPAQVKKIRVGSLQLADLSQFCEIAFKGKRQLVGRAKPSLVRGLICALVRLNSYGADRIYIWPWVKLCDKLIKIHKQHLAKHKGVRPKRWDSLHAAVSEELLARFQDHWDYIEKGLKSTEVYV